MTIVTTATSSGPYTASAQTTFSVTFFAAGASEIEVTLNNVTQSPSAYVFNRDDDGTGEVVFFSPVTGSVMIYSKPDFDQQTSFSRFGAFFPDQINPPLDKAAAKSLYLKSLVDIVVPADVHTINRTGKVLTWDADGDPIIDGGAIFQGNPGGNVMATGSAAALAAQTIAIGVDQLFTNDGGRWLADATLTVLNVAAFPHFMVQTANGRFFRRDAYNIDLAQVIVGNGLVDDSPRMIEALAYALRYANTLDTIYKGSPCIRLASYQRFDQTINIKQTVRIEGVGTGLEGGRPTIIDCTNGTGNGFVVERHNTLNDAVVASTTTGEGSVLTGFALIGGRTPVNSLSSAVGIKLKARAIIRDVFVHGFPGAGIMAVVSSGSGDPAFEGNANCSRIINPTVYNCLNGIWLGGSDANACSVENPNVCFNAFSGILDTSLLGNTYLAGHAQTNGLGLGSTYSVVSHGGYRYAAALGQATAASTTTPGTNPAVWIPFESGGVAAGIPAWFSGISIVVGGAYVTTNRNARSLFLGCYTEPGQAPPQISYPSMAVGGFFNNVGDAVGQDGQFGRLNIPYIGLPGGMVIAGGSATIPTSNPGVDMVMWNTARTAASQPMGWSNPGSGTTWYEFGAQ